MVKKGLVKIVDNSVIVKNPVGSTEFAKLTPCEGCKLYINGVEKTTTTIVREDDNINLEIQHKQIVRSVDVIISEDKQKAFLTFSYDVGIEYNILNTKEEENLVIKLVNKSTIEPSLFNEGEILEALQRYGVTYGIKFQKIRELVKIRDVKDVVIAEGITPTEAIDDLIEFVHKKHDEKDKAKSIYDKVDYKNHNKIESISSGTIIAEITKGYDGSVGKNVLGEVVYPKKEIRKEILCGDGCKKKGDFILATIDGQVFFKKNKITVNKVYNVNNNIDLSTGNINFHGDVTVRGSVTEGMSVCAQNNIKIFGSVYKSNIISRGNTEILGNIMNSKLAAGGKDIIKESRLRSLTALKKNIEDILNTIEFLKNKNLLNEKQKLGLVIKSLVDTKFTNFNKITMEAMSDILKDDDKKSKVLRFIKAKLVGISIMSINKISELAEGYELMKAELEELKQEGLLDSTISISYCQESFIQSTGDIEITGKGSFSTEFYSGGKIIFKDSTSVCRGGKVKAKNYIKLSTVGSDGGVQTIIELEDKKGKIEIDKAYNNTLIVIGNKQSYINVPSRNINCFIDKEGELIIEKFVL